MSYDQMTPEEQQAYARAREKVGEMKDFYSQVAMYIFVVVGLYFLLSPFIAYVTAFGWGMGLISQAFDIFFSGNWEERKIQQIMARERGEKAKRGGTLRSEEANADPYFDFADIGDDGELATTRIRNQEG